MHRNVYGEVKDYSEPVGHNNINPKDYERYILKADSNEHRWVSNTPFHPKYTKLSNQVEWEADQDNRPVNDHFNADKGYKFDVPVPYQERIPHVADRLGYPEQMGMPLERLFRLDTDWHHPQYLDQPFVQTPDPHPCASLNFHEGEVVYENTRVAEWNRFFMWGGVFGGMFGGVWYPYHLFCHSRIPWKEMTEGLPGSPYFEYSTSTFDLYNVGGVVALPIAIISWVTWLRTLHLQVEPYCTRLQYNADTELLFVQTTNWDGTEKEEAFEMEHLEIVPPSVKSGVKYLSSQDDDGLYLVTCLNSQKQFYVYKEDAYWNRSLKNAFLERVTRLWDDSYYDESKALDPEPELDPKVLRIE